MLKKKLKPIICIVLIVLIFSSSFSVYGSDIDNIMKTTNAKSNSIEEGTYYLINYEFNKCLQIDEDDSPNYNTSGSAMELWDLDGGKYQQWRIKHKINGYYEIYSLQSYMAITVPYDSLNSKVTLVQENYVGSENQLWSFEETSRGTYIIRPYSAESYSKDWCMCAADGLFSSNGRDVKQRVYDDNKYYKDEWLLIPYNGLATLCGIVSSGHDHSTALANVSEELIKNYYGISMYLDSMSAYTCKSKLDETTIFTSRSHGITVFYTGTENVASTGILLNDKEGSSATSLYSHAWSGMTNSSEAIEYDDYYRNIKLAVYLGCTTGRGGENARNLPNRTVERGAETAIGFTESIICNAANTWTENFYESLLLGNTVAEAVQFANSTVNESSGLHSAVICGNLDLVLN